MPVSDAVPQSQLDSESNRFHVQFWGVRGSVPTPGRHTVRYGGNTACVELRLGKRRLIFDGGTGLRVLGMSLLKEMPVEAHLFFAHTHWDHIQGFPFFVPAFIPVNRFHIYGAIAPDGSTIKERLSDQMVHPNFPVPLHVMQSDLKFYDIVPGDRLTLAAELAGEPPDQLADQLPDQLDQIVIETAPLNHPNVAVGYRITWQGRTVVYCTDTEHFADRFDENVLYLARDADVLIYDATYTDEEYYNLDSPKVGWGHSTWQMGVEIAKKAGVKQVVMYQHDPSHDDDFLDHVEAEVKAAFPGGLVAREGMILDVL